MSYEDLVAAQTKRAAKEQAKATASPRKRGPKPKKAVLQPEEQRSEKRRYEEPEGEEVNASKAKHSRKRKNLETKSKQGAQEMSIASAQVSPVARKWSA